MLGRTALQPTIEPATVDSTALRVTIVLNAATAARLDATCLAFPDTDLRVHGGTLASFVANGPALRWTDVLICQISPENPRDFEQFDRFVHDNVGRLPVVAAVRDLSVAVTRRVLRSAAIDVLPIPFTPDELHQAIETGRDARSKVPSNQQPRGGRVVAFVGALGGVGTTTLATQAAMIWASTRRVCLIDLDVQFGNAALYLNQRPQLSLADLIDAGDRLDIEFLRSVAAPHPTGLQVIACPPDIMPLDALTPEFVDKLLDVAAQAYDIVIVDLPGAWTNWSLGALQKSDIICLISGLSVPGVHQAKRQLELIDANGLGERTKVVLNRVITPLFGKTDVSATEAALRRKVHFAIANDYPTVSSAIDEGRSIAAIKLKSRVEKDVRALVASLATLVSIEATTK
jgi:pilus assembly protein CpaE